MTAIACGEIHRAGTRISPAKRRPLPMLCTALSTDCVDAVAERLLSSRAGFPDVRVLGHFGRAVRLQGKGGGRLARRSCGPVQTARASGIFVCGCVAGAAACGGNVSPRCHHDAMRPALRAGLLPVWRDRGTLQIGVNPRRAVALSGMGGAAAVVALLDGSRDWAGIIEAAGQAGVPAEAARRVLGLLAGAGALAGLPGTGARRAAGGPARTARGRTGDRFGGPRGQRWRGPHPGAAARGLHPGARRGADRIRGGQAFSRPPESGRSPA